MTNAEKYEKFMQVEGLINKLFGEGATFTTETMSNLDRYFLARLLAVRAEFLVGKSDAHDWLQIAEGYRYAYEREVIELQNL